MLSSILGVFTELIAWGKTALLSIIGLFYNVSTSELTFFGILAVTALGISIFFLLVRVVQNFLHFRS